MPSINGHLTKRFFATLLVITMKIMLLLCIIKFLNSIHTSGRSLLEEKEDEDKDKDDGEDKEREEKERHYRSNHLQCTLTQ